ncbi:dihydroxyacetone kinase family protein [Kineosporia mesophila]|uniref:Dihydroxyacetone kinase family protein n=1 Tax=Kineosporia mesophila TaxID=566012 RepID=A0ABP6Z4F7_9ACTN|nr:dihydroxyacetone kinase family protein [Kineosporia mesophila]MCD5352703.1 dihydroxyacetone kinase family protein [Kineosporia mesophila]
MTRLINDPAAFADEMTEGFVAAHADRVCAVPGGVVRATEVPAGQVAVVVGGGSGHYPAFAGLVGAGLADGAVLGNVFASPSAQQVVSVGRATERGGGILLSYGNYAGDCLNFDAAQERLRDSGIEVRTVRVTDDICSAPISERGKRRGIAGDLVVFKTAGAAAAQGLPLEQVTQLAQRANDRTRSIGVAFSGCTLPGASQPLFTVPEGRMAVGLGIHGEPGLDEVDLPTADGLAQLLVERLLAELPEGVERNSHAAVLLNGLGTVKHEELFVVYRKISQLLEDAGVSVVAPEVGELCTSFDMAGVSLTLTWLDPELEDLWLAPADSPAFRRGTLSPRPRRAGLTAATPEAEEIPPATDGSKAAAGLLVELLSAVEATIETNVEELGRIDAVAGDGDHGIGMQRGARAAAAAGRAAYSRGAGAGSVLTVAGDAWADKAGGTSGALWGMALRRMGIRLGDQAGPTAATVAQALHEARTAITETGGARLGDKTLVDVLIPLDETYRRTVDSGSGGIEAAAIAAAEGEKAAAATSDLLPRTGRARPHAERSLGTPDAGAVSLSLVARTVHTTLSTVLSTTTGR